MDSAKKTPCHPLTGAPVGRYYQLSGRVQGVFYRRFAQQEARLRGITGWVRNLPTGDVAISAYADLATLHAFEARLEEGPPMASVKSLRCEEIPYAHYDAFTIHA